MDFGTPVACNLIVDARTDCSRFDFVASPFDFRTPERFAFQQSSSLDGEDLNYSAAVAVLPFKGKQERLLVGDSWPTSEVLQGVEINP